MWYEGIISRGAEPVRWVLVAAIAYTLATTIWTFFETPVTSTVQETTGQQSQVPTRPPANVNWILSKHLFGEAGAGPVQEVDNDEPAVQTRLPLELQSVFVADETPQSAAIVAQRGKPGKLYSVGDTLPGNAELVDVLTDRIILRRAGSRETLMFPKIKNEFIADPVNPEQPDAPAAALQSSPPRQTATRPTRNEPAPQQEMVEPAAVIDEYQEKLANDAAGTLDELGIEPVDATAGGGYRIGDLASSPYFRQTGLQPGDVILSVNGRPVGNIQTDRMELANIIAQGSARIEIQRGSRRFFITAPLSALNR